MAEPTPPPDRSLAPDLELREVRRGRLPGSRYVRLTPRRERAFERVGPGYRATAVATRPRSAIERALRGGKRVLVGTPLASSELEEQKISKVKALAVFSSDALSSSAYATDEILLVLIAAGAGALTRSIEIALAIGILLAIVTFSYRQTIRAYPNGGGAYIVAKENLGVAPGLTAAAALSVDYVLTVSVSLAAGVFAITSAFPELGSLRVELALGLLVIVTLANLRGIRDSSTAFSIPTYAFIVSFLVLIIVGFIRIAIDPGLRAPVPESATPAGTSALTAFLLLRAFASGSAALTGVEAISNGIPAFKRPESKNAATTLVWMVVILSVFFIGLTILAHQLDVRHAAEISVPAQIAQTLFGKSVLFYAIQASTALILILAANTSYADFPRLGAILANDKFLPHQFAFRGDRLGFSHGIFALAASAAVLLVAFGADVDRLIPLYAFGVFVSFTLSQSGMVVHWLHARESGWKRSIAINAVGAIATGVVAIIIGGTKFTEGAWISMLLMLVLGLMFAAVHRHYARVKDALELPPGLRQPLRSLRPPRVVVPVSDVGLASLRTLEYARTLSPTVVGVHVATPGEDRTTFQRAWDASVSDVPLLIIDSPRRSLVAPMLQYLDDFEKSDPGADVLVAIPQVIVKHFWQQPLHNQNSARLRRALVRRPRTAIVEVPCPIS